MQEVENWDPKNGGIPTWDGLKLIYPDVDQLLDGGKLSEDSIER